MEKAETTELRCLCPYCGSLTQSGRIDAKFYYNPANGLYHCFHCLVSGKDLTLEIIESLEIVDTIAKKPFNASSLAKLDRKAPELELFLNERFPGVSSSSRSEATSGLGYSLEHKAIAIPIQDFDGETVGLKYRLLDPEAKPRYLSEPGSVNEGYWIKGTDQSKLLVVEGELDALTAQLAGFKGYILATQTNRLNPNQQKRFKAFRNVFILPDQDLGGLELERSCIELLGAFKATFIKLDDPNSKDLGEYLQKGGYDACVKFIAEVTRTEFEKATVGFFSESQEMVEFLSDIRNTRGTSTGYGSLDRLLGGGIRDKEITIVSALMKVGKTSFINNLVHNKAKLGQKIAVASFEMDGPLEISPSIISIATEINLRNLENKDDINAVVEAAKEESQYLNNITYLRQEGDVDWDQVAEWAVNLKKSQGLDYLVLDHVGFLVSDIKDATETRRVSKSIKSFAKVHNVKIILAVQQGKSKDEPGMTSVDGGIGFAQICHNFLTLQRNKDDNLCLEVKLKGYRYAGCKPSNDPVLLFYQPETCALLE